MSQASNSIVIASCFSSFRSKPFKQTANGLVTNEKQLTNDTKINYLFLCVCILLKQATQVPHHLYFKS